mmetsp:Transcript_9767/g.42578  ORF Transcript_9767/g.42578 Transcript_9767/m.42578 type:complete len:261 (-) Transcript_9767:2773-3555(-)
MEVRAQGVDAREGHRRQGHPRLVRRGQAPGVPSTRSYANATPRGRYEALQGVRVVAVRDGEAWERRKQGAKHGAPRADDVAPPPRLGQPRRGPRRRLLHKKREDKARGLVQGLGHGGGARRLRSRDARRSRGSHRPAQAQAMGLLRVAQEAVAQGEDRGEASRRGVDVVETPRSIRRGNRHGRLALRGRAAGVHPRGAPDGARPLAHPRGRPTVRARIAVGPRAHARGDSETDSSEPSDGPEPGRRGVRLQPPRPRGHPG